MLYACGQEFLVEVYVQCHQVLSDFSALFHVQAYLKLRDDVLSLLNVDAEFFDIMCGNRVFTINHVDGFL